jgi:hypothetical protein
MEIDGIIKTHFSSECGFGDSRQIAIDLLKKTICILEDFDINYCLISGTLLGYVRHNDFIPWDDDIDLIVDSVIFDKIPEIAEKYGDDLNFAMTNYMVKMCFKNKGDEIQCVWTDRMLNKGDKYNWPFIDLFFYSKPNDKKIVFFNKRWDVSQFFPPNRVLFNGITVNIPKNPDYFLVANYGNNYMTVLKSNVYSHKTEKRIANKKTISLKKYLENK